MSDPFLQRRRFQLRAPWFLALAGAALVAVAFALGMMVRERDFVPPSPVETRVSSLPRTASPASVPAPDAPPRFDIVRINPAGDAVMAGHAAPGAEVVILDGGRELGRTQADAQGSWVFLPSEQLAAGARELTLAEHLPSGSDVQGEGSVLLVVPDRPLVASTGAAPAEATMAPTPGPIAILTGRESARVLQAPTNGRGLGLTVADYDAAGAVRFSGRAPPGTAVRLYADSQPIGDAVADGEGRWSLTPKAVLASGAHLLRLDQLDARGRVVARVEVPFNREVADAGTPTSGAPMVGALGQPRIVVQQGQTLWQLARRVYGDGLRYTVIYQANEDQIRDPKRIYPGQSFSLPATVAARGDGRGR
jgi:hypothetical protein